MNFAVKVVANVSLKVRNAIEAGTAEMDRMKRTVSIIIINSN